MGPSINNFQERFFLLDLKKVVYPDRVEVREPIGWGDLKISVKRLPEDRGGAPIEYGSDNTKLEFGSAKVGVNDSSFEVISNICGVSGVNFAIALQYEVFINRAWTIQFEGIISEVEFERTLVAGSVKRNDFAGTLFSNWEADIDVTALTDLRGNAIKPLELITVPLPQKIVRREFDGEVDAVNPPEEGTNFGQFEGVGIGQNKAYFIFAFQNVAIGGLRDYIQYGQFIFSQDSITATETDALSSDAFLNKTFILKAAEAGEYQIDFDFDLTVFHETGLGGGLHQYRFRFWLVRETEEGETTVVQIAANDFLFTTNTVTEQEVHSYSSSLELQQGENVYLYGWTFTPSAIANQQEVSATINSANLNIVSRTSVNPSLIKGHFIHKVLNQAMAIAISGEGVKEYRILFLSSTGTFLLGETVQGNTSGVTAVISSVIGSLSYRVDQATGPFEAGEIISGLTSGFQGTLEHNDYQDRPILDSSYLGAAEDGFTFDGCGAMDFITNGYLIRQFDDRGLRVKIKELVRHASYRYSCGWQPYRTTSGTTRVVIEEDTYFFTNNLITNLAPQQNYPAKRSFNTDLAYNLLDVGWGKFGKADEDQTLGGFNTNATYEANVQRINNKKQVVSDLIADGEEIARLQRESQGENAGRSSSTDDNLFVIRMYRFDNATPFDPSLYGNNANRLAIEFDTGVIKIRGLVLNNNLELGGVISGYNVVVGTITYSIDTITQDATNNQTVITTSDSVTPGVVFDTFYFQDNSLTNIPVFAPQRIEGFVNVSGVDDPLSEWNLFHAPTSFLSQNIGYLYPLSNTGSDVFKFLTGKNNKQLQYTPPDPCIAYTLPIRQDQNIGLSTFPKARLFGDFVYKFEMDMEAAQLFAIKESYNNRQAGSYGYVQFLDEKGILQQGYVMEFSYNPTNRKTNMTIYARSAN